MRLICDSGERYRQTYYEPSWLAARGLDPGPYEAALMAFLERGELPNVSVQAAANPDHSRGAA